jgi:hypothetical protein
MMRPAPLLAALALLAACAPTGTQPETRSPAAILRLDRMKDMDARRDWTALAATDPGACSGPNDAVCGESQALRARGCRMLAEAATSAATKRPQLDCAVEAGRAALAASAATPPAERDAWREALAWSLFQRRQIQPRAALCPDNAALRQEADALGGALPDARFLAASARLSDVVEGCGAPAAACTNLSEARRLLTPAPAGNAPWTALAAAVASESRSRQCR